MSEATTVVPRGSGTDRVIGRYDAGRPGPTLVVVAGQHGNEPAGVAAVRAVIERLQDEKPPLAGRFIGLIGNLEAFARRRRYVHQDLNRMWTQEQVERLRGAHGAALEREEVEQRELLALFDALAAEHAELVFLDLHSTSSESPPFHCISDTLHSRAIALATPIPLILGVEEAIHGSLLEYMEERGWPMVLVEAGQHDAPETVRYHEAAIWQALVVTGALEAADAPELANRVGELRAAARGLPRVVEITHRHAIGARNGFRMRPGFPSFHRVRRGDVLADDNAGPIAAPADGLLVMPLYQEQGEDGFFIARPVRRSWLSVSTLLRTLRVDRLLPHFPGVHRDPRRPTQLLVDTKVARWFTVQLFHLCGFRRLHPRDGRLVFTRRVEG